MLCFMSTDLHHLLSASLFFDFVFFCFYFLLNQTQAFKLLFDFVFSLVFVCSLDFVLKAITQDTHKHP